jgi:opacity protein-like surface antigen
MKYSITLFSLMLPTLCLGEPPINDPCDNFLSVLNRPTVADSVCVVKPGKVIIELGTQYQDLYPGNNHGINFPDSQFRFGLPGSNEFTLLPPNYIRYNGEISGYTATVLGLKHQFPNENNLNYTVEGIFTLPTGDRNFGSDGLGVALNGIVNYGFTAAFSVAMMVGITSETTSSNAGGDRFTSFNPDLVFSWQVNDNLQIYAETYGETKTAPHAGSGFNADAGIQYLPSPNIELDIEYGQRLSGELGGFAHYLGAGGGIRF